MLALYKITNKQALFQQGAVWGKIWCENVTEAWIGSNVLAGFSSRLFSTVSLKWKAFKLNGTLALQQGIWYM